MKQIQEILLSQNHGASVVSEVILESRYLSLRQARLNNTILDKFQWKITVRDSLTKKIDLTTFDNRNIRTLNIESGAGEGETHLQVQNSLPKLTKML